MKTRVRHENLFVEYFLNRQNSNGCGCGEGNGCGSHDEGRGCGKEEDGHSCGCSGKVADDNRDELFDKFRLEFSEIGGRFGTGYNWVCQDCSLVAKSHEEWFDCQKRFVTILVRCHQGCHRTWYLEIRPVSIQVTVDGISFFQYNKESIN